MKGLEKRGKTWYISFQHRGVRYRQSCETSSKKAAEEVLCNVKKMIFEGRFAELKVKDTSYSELRADLITDYRINKKRSIDRLMRSIGHLDSFFADMQLFDITSDSVKDYILGRQEDGAANATVNRELAALKRMLNLGHRATPPKVIHVPYIPKLEENNVRQGYYEHNQFIALREALPHYLQPVVTMAYFTGMRKEEMLGLQWNQVDLDEGKISLKPDDTKTKEGRVIYMHGELLEAILNQRQVRDTSYPGCQWVFFGKTGDRIKDFRWAWSKACKEVGLEGRTMHDFRRTAIRNMVRKGIQEKVAMMISGHKTRSVFDRYNIVNEDDLKLAARKMHEPVEEKKCHKNATKNYTRPGLSATTEKPKAPFLKLIQ